MLQISDKEYSLMKSLIYDRCGIDLTEKKRGLLVTRLNKELRKLNFDSIGAYYDYVISDQTGQAFSKLVDLISTNHTYFFREKEHFEILKSTILPEWLNKLKANKTKDIRVWCAASSTGEEPYGLGMILMEAMGAEYSSWDAGILATDIAPTALSVAKKGIYKSEQLDPIPANLRKRYFQKNNDETWKVKPSLKKQVTFRRLNLMRETFPFKKPFHIIFCRNVMIYFDRPTIQRLVNHFYEWLVPGGYLFVGHSESLGRIDSPFTLVKPAVYQKL